MVDRDVYKDGVKREDFGVPRIESGSDGDMVPKVVPASEDTATMKMPSDVTQDSPKTQDRKGKPFFETLEERRGQPDHGTVYDSPGGYGGPNSQ